MHKLLIAAVLCVLAGTRAGAQGIVPGEPDTSKARVRFGPLFLNPGFALTNLGVDTNIFNEASDQSPKRDFTMTLEPTTDAWLRVGRTWVTGRVDEQLVWFQKYTSERSFNGRYELGWLAPLNRLIFRINGTYLHTRERPGFEIDVRPRRREQIVDGALEIRALSRTFFGVRADRRIVDFDRTEEFLGSNLQIELNRVSTTGGLTIRHQLTPLTAFIFDASRTEDRFEFSPLRDADSTAFSGAVRFDPFALIKGGATIGYRHFKPIQSGLPDYKGSTVAADLSYTMLGTTRFGMTATRDIQYSYDINEPYYLLTGITGSIAQQLFGPVDVVARIGAEHLAYRSRTDDGVGAVTRTDRIRSYGGGIGYHMGRDLRIGFNIDEQRRTSPVSNREYEGLRFGTSVTYGS